MVRLGYHFYKNVNLKFSPHPCYAGFWWLTFFKKRKPAQNLLFALFAAFFIRIRPKGDNVRSGGIYLNNNSLRACGDNGYAWSPIAGVYGSGTWSTLAYDLTFGPSGVSPSSNATRWYGFPVRCLVILVLLISLAYICVLVYFCYYFSKS